jgi:hypothetical protein
MRGVKWPQEPTITSPATFDKVVADAMKVLSNAVIKIGRPSRVEEAVNLYRTLSISRDHVE